MSYFEGTSARQALFLIFVKKISNKKKLIFSFIPFHLIAFNFIFNFCLKSHTRNKTKRKSIFRHASLNHFNIEHLCRNQFFLLRLNSENKKK